MSSEEANFSQRQFGNYKLIRQIGQGAMGVVYEANQIGLERKVALKLLASHLASDRTFIKRFHNEAAAAARINHPNIATVYDYGEFESGPYIAMEYIQGKTLEEIMSEGRVTSQKALDISEKVADALAFAHEHGIIHRDIKPGNIMIDESGRVVIMDFGLAKIENATLLTLDGTIMGTPGYMAPEQIQSSSENITPLSDIFSLGVLMYEMFTGQLPFKGANHMAVLKKVLEEEPVSPRKMNPKISRDLEVVILKSMEKSLFHRYPSAKEIAADIRRMRSGEPIMARPTTLLTKLLRKSIKYKGILWALGIAFLIAIIWTIYMNHQQKQEQTQYKKILYEAKSRLLWVQGEKEVLLEKLSEDPLFHVLESKDPLIRAQAVIALNQRLRDRELKGKLLDKSFELTLNALNDPHPLVRRHAAILLGILKDQRAFQELINKSNDEDPDVRKHVILALGLLQNQESAGRIIEHLSDKNEEVRASAALSLGLLRTKKALDPLIESLKDPYPKVRSNVAATLGSIGDLKAIQPLIKLLKDPVEEVRQSARESLSKYGEESRMPVMISAFEDETSEPKEVVRFLKEINPETDVQVVDSVIKLLKNKDTDVRYHAVLILGLFEDQRAVPYLIESLKDQESPVKDNARLALIGLTGQDYGVDVEKWQVWFQNREEKK